MSAVATVSNFAALATASGDNTYTTMFVVQYVITIPLAIYALFFMPGRGTRSPYMENIRRNSALFGLLPCGPLAIVIALVGEGIYYITGKSSRDAGTNLAAKWKESGGASSDNPFGEGSTGSASSSSGSNPFAGGSNSSSVQQPPSSGGNPFAEGGNEGSSGESGRPNPFA